MMPFMMGGDKKIASMIVAKGSETKEVSDNETDYSVGMEAAGRDIAEAIEKKDSKLLVQGLKDLFAMLMDEHESKPLEDEGEEEDEKEPKSSWK